MSDWAFVGVVAATVLALAFGAWTLWLRGRTQAALAVALPVPFLILLEALMIWYAATGGVHWFDGL